MIRERTRTYCADERGFAVVYTALVMTGLLLFTGLAIDSGRAYIVKAQLTKAVDGAALAAARHLNSGDPRGEAVRLFKANFPAGFMGTTTSPDPTASPSFFSLVTDRTTGVNVVKVTATTALTTSFMGVGEFEAVAVGGMGEATRRMVDLSLVLDVSSSIGAKWPAVRDAARSFVTAFDAANDRLALVTYSNGARVLEPMRSSRGFDKTRVVSAIPAGLPGGSTAMVEGLYRGWDELRSVGSGQQSSLRVIVLFTDGASNSVPGFYDASPGSAKGLRTYDFPKNFPDPDNQTWDNPQINGLFDTETGAQSPVHSITVAKWDKPTTLAAIPWLPDQSAHTHHRSSGIPSGFPLQTSRLLVNGAPQNSRRGLRNRDVISGKYPADVWNINNAARNLLEIIADAARSDDGDYPIRIYTIGMGELVRYRLGTMPEKPEDILMRIANDKDSEDYAEDQLEGKYYFAETEADVGPAFSALQNEIIRLTK